MSNKHPPLFGIYRGIVTNNVDPLELGRIEANVPDANETPTVWALPCIPLGSEPKNFSPPPVGSGVWVAFEGGDRTSPLYLGIFNTLPN